MNKRRAAGWLVAIGLALGACRVSPGAENGLGERPYLGWSSWSLSATTRPGYGKGWLSAEHVKEQADALATRLGKHGYTYVNVDAGWRGGWDEQGRPVPDRARFPLGMRDLADHVHRRGQKLGIYYVPGIDDDLLRLDPPILGTTRHIREIVFTPRQQANHWGGHAIDFSKPGAMEYVQSIADRFAEWGVDFLKYDGVAPGSDIRDPSVDARPSVDAWGRALLRTDRPIWLTLSWRIDLRYNDTWRRYANALRTGGDVESYDAQLTHWPQVAERFGHARDAGWAAGRGKGWNDLDALLVGNGAMTGLTLDERRSAMTLWAIACSPLYSGDDLTQLDPAGVDLLTNDEVIAVNQAGRVARPAGAANAQAPQAWSGRQDDGSLVVALFNLDGKAEHDLAVPLADLGWSGPARLRDLWARRDVGSTSERIEAILAPHGCRLFRLTPPR